jgi:hypothetical protein
MSSDPINYLVGATIVSTSNTDIIANSSYDVISQGPIDTNVAGKDYTAIKNLLNDAITGNWQTESVASKKYINFNLEDTITFIINYNIGKTRRFQLQSQIGSGQITINGQTINLNQSYPIGGTTVTYLITFKAVNELSGNFIFSLPTIYPLWYSNFIQLQLLQSYYDQAYNIASNFNGSTNSTIVGNYLSYFNTLNTLYNDSIAQTPLPSQLIATSVVAYQGLVWAKGNVSLNKPSNLSSIISTLTNLSGSTTTYTYKQIITYESNRGTAVDTKYIVSNSNGSNSDPITTPADFIELTYRGSWSNTVIYTMGDTVVDNNLYYVYINSNDTSGVLTSVNTTWLIKTAEQITVTQDLEIDYQGLNNVTIDFNTLTLAGIYKLNISVTNPPTSSTNAHVISISDGSTSITNPTPLNVVLLTSNPTPDGLTDNGNSTLTISNAGLNITCTGTLTFTPIVNGINYSIA